MRNYHVRDLPSIVLVCLAISAPFALPESLRLAPLFKDHMVLQRDVPAPVWGWTSPGSTVTVEIAGQEKTGIADSTGAWRVNLDPLAATKPDKALTLTASDGPSAQDVDDVLVGEVWVCSGQSNMEMPLRSVTNAEAEVMAADFPAIRMFSINRARTIVPATDCSGAWKVCSPGSAGTFSAVGYFFGRHLHRQMDGVPVGLIVNPWSGMIAEPYTPLSTLKTNPLFVAMATNLEHQVADYLARKDELDRAHVAAQAVYKDQRAAWEREMEAADPGTSNAWNGLVVETNGWRAIEVPQFLEEADPAFKNASYTVWLRRELVVDAVWTNMALVLSMGPIDEVDITWVNGTEVGRTGFDVPQFCTVRRFYDVPAGLLKAGTNVIAMRIMNLYGEGGPVGTADMYKLEPTDVKEIGVSLPLAGEWMFRRGLSIQRNKMPKEPAPPISAGANGPASVYNAMVAPLIPYAIRGATWYQGESNAGRAWQYRSLLPTMIEGWRKDWGRGDFPFLIVQLANHMGVKPEPSESQWAEVREAQAFTAQSLPKCGLAVAIDIGDAADIHPRNKQDVGLRLGLAAEAVAYGRELVHSGPVYESAAVEGGKMRLKFRHVGGGLIAKGEGSLKGFAVAGADRKFVWADAAIDGATVVVSSANAPAPVAVRYAWADNPVCNLYNKEGLPAVPFRTDDWPGLTWPR